MRTASSSRRNPQEVIGKALSQSPACSDVTASIRARSEGSFAPASQTLRPSRTAALSQFLCLVAETSCGGMVLNVWHHDSRASEMHGSSPKVSWDRLRMASWSSSVAAADVRNAEGASTTTLRIPRPTSRMGRLDCSHAESSNAQLVMDVNPERKRESNRTREG